MCWFGIQNRSFVDKIDWIFHYLLLWEADKTELAVSKAESCSLGNMCHFELWFSQNMYSGVGLLGHRQLYFYFFKEPLYTFSSGCINSYSCQQWKRIPFSPPFFQHLLFVDFIHDGHSDLTYNDDLTVVLIHISLIISDVEFIAAIFIITMTWKQHKCPMTDQWIKKMWYIYTMEYYSAIKRNKIRSFVEM